MILAITGGTGFVGGHLLRLAAEAGHAVRALARRDRPPAAGVIWVPGALDDPAALDRLVTGSDAVIHVAGVVNAPDAASFEAGNVAGTQAMLDATARAEVRRIVIVSSLAARAPELSDYGRSKAAAEALVHAAPLGWDIVRPPAIYGPGDRELLELFRMARRGVVPLPPAGRLSVIHAEDLCRLLLTLAAAPAGHAVLEPDDGTPGGWSHPDFARAIGGAVGRRVLPLPLPRALLRAAALLDRLVRRDGAKLTSDRVRYFCHPDWVVHARPDVALWQPRIPTPSGLAATAAWYRQQGWL